MCGKSNMCHSLQDYGIETIDKEVFTALVPKLLSVFAGAS